MYFLFISHVLLAIHTSFGVYILYFIFSPKKSHSLIIMSLLLWGLIGAFLTIVFPPHVVITKHNGIDWFLGIPLSLFIIPLLFVSLGSFSFIFAKLFYLIHDFKVKLFSFFISMFGLVGIYNIFIRFILLYSASVSLRSWFFDNLIIIASAIFALIFLLFAIPWTAVQRSRLFSKIIKNQ